MTPILTPHKTAPDAMKALVALENYVQQSGLDHSLIDLVKIPASQINGCAYCIHRYTSGARTHGSLETIRNIGDPLTFRSRITASPAT
jgi:AhpD family alkylhydroperoxidase